MKTHEDLFLIMRVFPGLYNYEDLYYMESGIFNYLFNYARMKEKTEW